ncbi:MAG: hypothetical protein GY874_22715 [Desulfobacteraceae bacterium]|nr:hypothetical protein [Desulfobacteraceae bacterium]
MSMLEPPTSFVAVDPSETFCSLAVDVSDALVLALRFAMVMVYVVGWIWIVVCFDFDIWDLGFVKVRTEPGRPGRDRTGQDGTRFFRPDLRTDHPGDPGDFFGFRLSSNNSFF